MINQTNNGPKDAADYSAPLDALEAQLAPYADIELDAESSAALNDLKAEIMSVAKAAEADRVAIKEPHLKASRQVDADFKPVKARAEQLKKDAQAYLTIYLVERRRIADEAQAKAEAEAREKQRQADELASNEFIAGHAKQEAEEARKLADLKAAEQDNAGRAGSASGMARTTSLRTSYVTDVADARVAAAHYADHPKMHDLLITLANADMRKPDRPTAIPGMNIRKEMKAA